ncbi:MAG: deoxyribose-phosphate aldolase [Peptococcaceae bacterium]|jgi:deoxyribose-phosphate aldolase|nr:deoxyribose-phosphate aldolase [Peptococcaceae bacterium]
MTKTRMDRATLAGYLEYTLLAPTATRSQVVELCARAAELGVATVCVNPRFVHLASTELADTTVGVCTVVGFPLGAATTRTKALEARDAVTNGASELDVVLPIGALKEWDLASVKEDVAAVVAAGSGEVPVKAILETCYLTEDEITLACRLAVVAGASFVKTSTGFGSGGATVKDVQLMRKTVGPSIGVKAAGGIRTLQDALAMLQAGATRLGTSHADRILDELGPDY